MVDGVAYAPHRRVRARDLEVDFYAVSLYKVFGPHVSLMYVSRDLMRRLPGIEPKSAIQAMLGMVKRK